MKSNTVLSQQNIAASENSDLNINVSSEVGMLFSAERLRRKLSLRDISNKTHIRTVYLQAIEEGRLDELPGYVYTSGFIRSYAQYLGLDCQEILRRLNFPTEKEESQDFQAPDTTQEFISYLPSRKFIFYFVSLFFITFALILFIREYRDYNQQSIILEFTPPSTENESLAEEEEVNITPYVRKSFFPKMTYAKKQQGFSSINTTGLSTNLVRIIGTAPSWIEIRDPQDKIIFMKVLHENDSIDFKDSNLILTTGNAGGIKVEINGRTYTNIGKNAEVKRRIPLTQAFFDENYQINGQS